MKIKAILIAMFVSSLSVFGQGQINFFTPSASSTWRINTVTTGNVTNQILTTDSYTFFVMYGATGGALSSTITNISNSAFTTGKIGETAAGVSQTYLTTLTTLIDLQVFGFSTAAGSYANALATAGFFAGSSRIAIGVQPTQSPTGAQTVFAAAANGIVGFNLLQTAAVPEPSTMVLAGLGAASLLFFRRKKA